MPVSSTGTALGVGPATAADAVPARMKSCPGAEQHAVANVPRRAPEDRPQGATGNGARPPTRTPGDSRPGVPPAICHHRRIGIRRDRRDARALTAAAFRVRVGPAPGRHVHAPGVPGSAAPAVACPASRRGAPGPAPAARPARRGAPDGADRIGDQQLLTRGSVILQSAGDVRLTNAPAGRNGASSGDRRRRRGLRRMTAAAWPSRSRCRQEAAARAVAETTTAASRTPSPRRSAWSSTTASSIASRTCMPASTVTSSTRSARRVPE